MVREYKLERYITAGLITIGIFLLGLFLGLIIEEKRIDLVQNVNEAQKLDFNSMQIQYAFIDTFNQEESCSAVSKTFEENIKQLEDSRTRIEQYSKDSKISKNSFDLIKRDYILNQIRYWLLYKKTKEVCNENLVSILYFFSTEKKCPLCDKQAFVLTYLKKKFGGDLLIFSFDETFEQEPMTLILKNVYNITQYPTLIIEDKKLEGLKSRDDLLKEICPSYTTLPEPCFGIIISTNETNQTA